ISLAESEEDALNIQAIELDAEAASGTEHRLERVATTTVTATGDVEVFASNVVEVVAVAASLSIATDGLGGAGSGTSLNLEHGVQAFIADGTVVSADGSVYVDADDNSTAVAIGGAAAGGTSAGVGLSLANINMDRSVKAYVGEGADVTANGQGAGV